jgi:hypothetical protein
MKSRLNGLEQRSVGAIECSFNQHSHLLKGFMQVGGDARHMPAEAKGDFFVGSASKFQAHRRRNMI